MDADTETDGGGLAKNVVVYRKKLSKRQARYKKQLEHFKKRLHDMGWRVSFLNATLGLDDNLLGEELDERPEDSLVEEYAKSWVKVEQCASSNCDEGILYAAGLTRRISKKLSDVIAPLHNTCYSHRQLLDIAIEYVIGKYDKILKPGQVYLIDTPYTGVWTPNATFEYVYNAADFDRMSHPQDSLPGAKTSGSGKLFFHATSCRSALHIGRNGIFHLKGRGCLDFGIQPAFYMTPDFNTAIEWCNKNKLRWKGELCILVFNIPMNTLQTLNSKSYDSATSEWVALVTSSRQCRDDINDLDWFDVVYGPMAANVKPIEKENKEARAHKPPKFQLASKSNESDRYFAKKVVGVIFAPCSSSVDV